MAGVFGLRKVYIQQASNAEGDDALELNIPGLEIGYFVSGQSGYPGPTHTNMFRFEFSTDTNSVPSNNITNPGRYYIYGVSSEHAGYACGGSPLGGASFSAKSYADRIDFSNETTSSVANMPDVRSAGTTVWNNRYGYFCTGDIGSPPTSSTTRFDRLDFNVETWNIPSTNVSGGRVQCAGLINSSYGYVCGGPGNHNVVDRLDFSNESVSQPIELPVGKVAAMGVSSPEYGFIVAGTNPASPPYGSTVERLEFANETMSSPGNNMPVIRGAGANIYNKNHAIIGLGIPPTGTPWATCTVDRLDFTTETASVLNPTSGRRALPASIQANRPQVFRHVPGNSIWKESPNYGYSIGGYFGPPNAYSSKIIRLEYGTETATISPATDVAPIVRAGATGVYNTNYGYAAGGQPGGNISSVSRLEFSTETMLQSSTANLTQGRARLAGASDTNYGYTGGGQLGSPDSSTSTMDKLDFSNETVSANPSKLNQARIYLAGTQSDSYGYFGAGRTGPSSGNVCTIERLDFSSGTVSNPPASTTYDGSNMSAFASATNAYFFSGNTPGKVCTISRLDFVTDTSSDNPGQLSQARTDSAGVSNFGFGYVIGGDVPPGSTIIDRVDFTTDTVSTPGNIPGDGLRIKSATVNGGVSTRKVGGATYGYFAGGRNQPWVSTIDRLEFATETVGNTSTFAQLPATRAYITSTYNSNYGYFAGGTPGPGTTALCTIDRLDFSNETIAGAHTSVPVLQSGGAGVQNSNYGYFGGGTTPPGGGYNSDIERLDFSTESTSLPGNHLTKNRYLPGAVQSSSHGYFGGGSSSPSPTIYECTIDRLDFATETATDLGDSLDNAVLGVMGVETNNQGYFAGGVLTASPFAICVINRLDFTTETVSATSGQLTQARYSGAGANSVNYGYVFAGGSTVALFSTIDRLDFAAETVSTPYQSSTQARYVLAGVQNG